MTGAASNVNKHLVRNNERVPQGATPMLLSVALERMSHGLEIPDYFEYVELPQSPTVKTTVPTYTTVGANSYAADIDFANQYFIKGLIPRAVVGMMYGSSGAGKSFIVLDQISCIAMGWDYNGKRTKQAGVVYMCAEGAEGFRKRLFAYMKAKRMTEEQKEVYEKCLKIFHESVDMSQDAVIDGLINMLKALNNPEHLYKIMVVDTLACVSGDLDENTKQMNVIIENTKRIYNETGVMTYIVHHAGKDEARGSRGWSGLKGAMDFELSVKRTEAGNRSMKIEKMKDGRDGDVTPFKLDVINIGIDEDGDDVTSCTISWEAEITDRGEVLTSDQESALEIMRNLRSQNRISIYRKELSKLLKEKLTLEKPKSGNDSIRKFASNAITGLCKSNQLVQKGSIVELPETLDDENENENF